MALKAGRVGVAPDQVDEFGKINSDATQGYTKQEADAKFETKTNAASTYETKTDAANLQPKTLALPISMLHGSVLTVEQGFSGLADALTNKELTDMLTVQESAVTDIVNDATVDTDIGNHLLKFGKIVNLSVRLKTVTVAGWGTVVFKIPAGFRPKYRMNIIDDGNRTYSIFTNGEVYTNATLSSNNINLNATWITG